MEAVSGIWGYVVFWGLTALAAGIFLQRFSATDQTGYTGTRQRRTGPDNEEMFMAIVHFIAQSCQF